MFVKTLVYISKVISKWSIFHERTGRRAAVRAGDCSDSAYIREYNKVKHHEINGGQDSFIAPLSFGPALDMS